ncbi:DotA/TraY family protein [Achromobacter animicus]|uniref:DotA/TraY family protein n=1 Tax=Achromobacter animicus TaxID=1389935 RepID=UPI002448BDA3|nr:DotA/TraY family protein [Achromobacter animicus]MDH0682858.1 DotA/TraY family protein [Achromobacter animicus]
MGMRIFKARHVQRSFVALLLVVCSLLTQAALAQQRPPTSDELEQAIGRETDKSYEVLRMVFGQFAENPFLEVGTPDSLLGHVFLISNLVIMGLGIVWFTYNILAGILTSAHEGRVLGQKMSSAWLPVRTTVGVAGMLPVFGGFSAAQALFMWFTLLGIGAANMSLHASIDAAANYAPLVQSEQMVNPLGSGVLSADVADALFVSKICVLANRAYDSPEGYNTGNLLTDKLDSSDGAWTNQIYGERLCGGVHLSGLFADNARSGSGVQSALSYRVESIDYDAIAKAGRQAMVGQLRGLNALVDPIAVSWFRSYQNALANGTPMPEWPTPQLEKARKGVRLAYEFLKPLIPKQSAIRKEASDKIKRDGWAVLGAWNSTIAEANAAIVDAANVYSVSVIAPGSRVGFGLGEIGDQLRGIGQRVLSKVGLADVPQTDQVRDALAALSVKRETAAPGSECFFDAWQTETGNCSMGQALALRMIDGIAANSGGNGLVNPIIASKNVGDWLMMLPQVAYVASKAKDLPVTGKAASAAATGVSKAMGTFGPAALKMFGPDTLRVLEKLAIAMFIVGAILAIYIPFVPFLTWMTGLVGYFCIVVEGLVAGQLMAFAHLSGEGDGMGARTERGYTHLPNVLLRPTLMVVSFYIANAMSIMIATLFLQLFAAALANVQGNSVTGIATIIGVVVLFVIGMIVMIQGIYNMVYEIPDRSLGWIGSAMEARFGREMDNKIEMLAQTTVRWSGVPGAGIGRA